MTLYVRVQEKGQVTIPTKLRKKLNIKKGDTVMVIAGKEIGKTGKILKVLTGKCPDACKRGADCN